MSSIANGSIDRQDIADVDNGGTRNSKNIRGPRTRPRLRENGSAPAASHQDDRRKLRGSDDEDDESLDGLDAWGGGADDPFGEEEAAQELVASRRRDGARMPGEMATWSGRPAIKGSSEAVRMVLLNFCTIGIT